MSSLTEIIQRMWTAPAAAPVVGMAVGVALFAIWPQPADADDAARVSSAEAICTSHPEEPGRDDNPRAARIGSHQDPPRLGFK